MRATPGQVVYGSRQEWLRSNDPNAPLAAWSQISGTDQRYWEALAISIHRAVTGRRTDGFFCGLTFGFLTAALVFIFARV